MMIIRNSLLPFKRFTAMNLFGIVFCRKDTMLTPELINHERIHTAQLLEMGIVGFYVWYVAEWLVKLPFKGNAYRKISFEREAYLHMDNLQYLQQRKHYCWWQLLRVKAEKVKNNNY